MRKKIALLISLAVLILGISCCSTDAALSTLVSPMSQSDTVFGTNVSALQCSCLKILEDGSVKGKSYYAELDEKEWGESETNKGYFVCFHVNTEEASWTWTNSAGEETTVENDYDMVLRIGKKNDDGTVTKGSPVTITAGGESITLNWDNVTFVQE